MSLRTAGGASENWNMAGFFVKLCYHCLFSGYKPKKSLKKKLDSLSKEKSKDKGNEGLNIFFIISVYVVKSEFIYIARLKRPRFTGLKYENKRIYEYK